MDFDREANKREIARLDAAIARIDFVRDRLLPFIGLMIIIVILATR